MRNGQEAEKAQLIETLTGLVEARWPPAHRQDVERFVAQYYCGIAAGDILERSSDDLYGAAVSHWHLAQRYRGEPLVHVYNPDPEQHGWESTHSIVQVVTADRPFLVDSVSMALNRHGLTIHLIIHPVIPYTAGDPPTTLPAGENGELRLACMHFEVDRQTEPEAIEALQGDLAQVLEDVRLAVQDWRVMGERLREVADELEAGPPPKQRAESEEAVAFLRWLADNHFTFLGYRCYDLQSVDGQDVLRAVPDSGLGILREHETAEFSHSFAALPEAVRRAARSEHPLIVTKSNSRSRVHRPAHMDYIGVKRFDKKHRVIGEHRFLGLYTSAAYNRNPRTIPLLRQKVDSVLERADLAPDSHDGKALLNILETYPRDELFQIDPETLYRFSLGMLHLQERQRTKLFVRYDTYRRFVSCLIYAPRERYNTEVRERMQEILLKAFGGYTTEFAIQLSESVLARIHIIVRLDEPDQPEFDQRALEAQLAATVRSWTDDYYDALLDHFGEERGNRLYRRYREAFNAAYREDITARAAAHDTERLEALDADAPVDISLYRPLESANGNLRFKLFHRGRPIALSDVLPMLENMGVRVVDEHPYDVAPLDDEVRWIHDFGLLRHDLAELEPLREIFEDAFAATWQGKSEDDGFNQLVLAAGLDWRRIIILRAYCKYLRQSGTTLSQAYVEETLARYPAITRRLVELFFARLDPEGQDAEREQALAQEIEVELEHVPILDEDRILRRYVAAIRATLRTNYFQRSGGELKPYLSFKLAPAEIPDTPEPHPAYEIFVYALDFEGTHLRGGQVARGGLRWSDRREDFRTEILGLMKAQMVKNAVIVPVGAKGGFVLKHPPSDREALQQEVRACYSNFIRGLLDITDNRVEDRVVAPTHVVRHDGDDPYLVVAADKGTATFSDLANSVSEEYGFWLRDAFASGGSSGYDHKKMGITARGGWEAVRRHFRELGVDIQREAFTVAGVGDMSGDVFGNGMLLSRHIKLVAAFDHRHIFLDPDPDPAASYAERERLFALQRSSWDDYDHTLLSEGGGIYSRSMKSITISPQAQAALGTERNTFSPIELIRVILTAPVDLLWNGGIGTYVKASTESNTEVGDKTNDPLRVNGRELRARVVGEGGNLGFTQYGRIEYALHGGRINTDAIDNSGGVDCSDHEVNIKILLNELVDNGDLTLKHRNQLLNEMTEEVARHVLSDNYHQTEAISLAEARAGELLDEHARLMRYLERRGLLDRALEDLPSDEEIQERAVARRGLTRPELAVMLAYAKIDLYGELLGDPVLQDPYLVEELFDYFPEPLEERYPEAIRGHRLREELAATVLTNDLINHMGFSFLYRVEHKTGATAGEVARAYIAAREIYDLRGLWRGVEALDGEVSAVVQIEMLIEIATLHEAISLWLLRNLPGPLDIGATVQALRPAVESLQGSLDAMLPEQGQRLVAEQRERLEGAGVPSELARQVAGLDFLYSALDIGQVSAESNSDLDTVACVYFTAAEALGVSWLRAALDEFGTADPWQERLRIGLQDEIYAQLRRITADVLAHGGEGDAPARVERWIGTHRAMTERLRQTNAELQSAPQIELPMLAVAVHDLKLLAGAGKSKGG